MKAKVDFSNIVAYLQGWLRYKLYYSRFKFLIRKHIIEQIDFRIKYMDKECYENGSCKLCGCATTALQMANKQCEKPCYPPILNRFNWDRLRTGQRIIVNGQGWWLDWALIGNTINNYRVLIYTDGNSPNITQIHPRDMQTLEDNPRWKKL